MKIAKYVYDLQVKLSEMTISLGLLSELTILSRNVNGSFASI